VLSRLVGAFTSDAPPVAAAVAGFFALAAAGAALELVALSDGACDQASGAQLSSAGNGNCRIVEEALRHA